MIDRVKGFRLAIALTMVAVTGAVGYATLPASRATAQAPADVPVVIKTAGPVGLNHSESALIGLLLPAVQRGSTPFRLQIFGGNGALLANIQIVGIAARSAGFYEVTFVEGNFRVTNKVSGELVAHGAAADTTITAILLPAVQTTGRALGSIGASVQIMTPTGGRGQVIQMCDGSV